jgi:hypothetical protein
MKKRNNIFLEAAQEMVDRRSSGAPVCFCCWLLPKQEKRRFVALFHNTDVPLDTQTVVWPRLSEASGEFDWESRIFALLLADIIYNEK